MTNNKNTNTTNSMVALKVVELPNGKQTTATADRIAFVKHSDQFGCFRFCFLFKPSDEAITGFRTFAKSYTKGDGNKFVPDLDICWWSPKKNRSYYSEDVLTRKLAEARYVVVSEDCFVSLVNERIADARAKDEEEWNAFISQQNAKANGEEAVTIAYNEADKEEEEANAEVAKAQKALDEAKARAKAKAEAKAKEATKTEAVAVKAPTAEVAPLPTAKQEAIKAEQEAPKQTAESTTNSMVDVLMPMLSAMVAEALNKALADMTKQTAEAPTAEAPKQTKGKGRSKAKASK